MNLNISLNDWHSVLQDAMWWETYLHPDHAIMLYKYTRIAYNEGSKYYVRGPGSSEVELTKLYEQFKLLHILRAEYK